MGRGRLGSILLPVAKICNWHQQLSTTLMKLVEKFATAVSLIPVVHLDLRISPQMFKKIQNGLNGILWGWGETNS
jgi:hypothetical protein